MIIVLTGSNDFLRQQKFTQLRDDFIQEYGEFSLQNIDASEKAFGQILDTIATQPFLSAKQLVILGSILQISDINDKFEELINAAGENTTLIINEPKFDKRSRLYKSLKQTTEFFRIQ